MQEFKTFIRPKKENLRHISITLKKKMAWLTWMAPNHYNPDIKTFKNKHSVKNSTDFKIKMHLIEKQNNKPRSRFMRNVCK